MTFGQPEIEENYEYLEPEQFPEDNNVEGFQPNNIEIQQPR